MVKQNTMTLDDSDLWFAGYIAYNFAETESNPHPEGTYEFHMWNSGYEGAKKDESRDIPEE
ncbi:MULTISPECIES: hypothetical protein [Acinetobacter]|uniref:hypothetical protein n=1 Tax=Acinetobacter TaxID=469 RepID=UPI0015D0E495|nr:hypothetical protein [Acinetobacter sp. YH01009]